MRVVTWPPLLFDLEQVDSSISGPHLRHHNSVSHGCLKQKTLEIPFRDWKKRLGIRWLLGILMLMRESGVGGLEG